MARVGQMMLDGGSWNGVQVVSPDWVATSTSRLMDAGSGPEGYGYLWWTMEAPEPDGTTVPAFFANGWGSQFIVGIPSLELLLVTTGGNEYNGKHLSVAGALTRYLLPAVQPR
jgi:CubicO group peptidase (beta-lactamase class C family)